MDYVLRRNTTLSAPENRWLRRGYDLLSSGLDESFDPDLIAEVAARCAVFLIAIATLLALGR